MIENPSHGAVPFGDAVERLVWADIESFLLGPEEILERLREHLLLQDRERPLRKKELETRSTAP